MLVAFLLFLGFWIADMFFLLIFDTELIYVKSPYTKPFIMPRNLSYRTFIVLFCFFCSMLFTANHSEASENGSRTQNGLKKQSDFSQSLELNHSADNFFRRLFGERTKSSSGPRKSNSKKHKSTRPQRYSPPASSSQNPESHGNGGSNQQSDMSSVRNTPKPPLQRSRKDEYQNLGLWEVGFSVSSVHALTDIGASKGLGMSEFSKYHTSNYSFGGGIFGRYIMNDWFAMNLGMNFVNISAGINDPMDYADADVYSFNNDIFEFYGKTEFRLPGLSTSPFDLYGFVGIGILFSDATIFGFNDRLITTQEDYSQVQPFIPFGGGFAVKVTDKIRIGYEFGWRNTIFHYLDGVKIDDTYDHYFLNSIKIGFVF
jgi:hypothetical protein